MTVIRLGERSAGDGKFTVRVHFGDYAEYDVQVTDPADEAAEQELAWYFEEHLRYPFLDADRERGAVRQIAAYGAALFGQVFGGKANHDYRTLRERSFDDCRLEVSGPAALHRLHWEALRDPDLDSPLAVRLPVTRRVDAQPSGFAVRGDLPTLNILVVTARPGGPHDVGYRTISRPLLDALRTAGQPVTVDLVRPGTWDALRAHLADTARGHGSGWYQVVHFDLHGAFTGYDALARGTGEGGLLFSPGAVPPFDGQRGFLFFETERDAVAHPVPAETVASLLAEHRIGVAVLNACQSATQTASEAGLAQRLAEAGVPVAMGMGYSVTVSAAERSMPVVYQHLSAGADPVAAVHAARRELYDHRGRRAYYDQEIDLEDWLLPVVFSQRRFQVKLRAMTGAEQAGFYERSALVGDEPATEYGFVGRDLDIQAVERRLLARPDSNELLVRGMAGAGKSALLAHLAWWWQRTGLVGQAFRFSYEDRAWTVDQIVRGVRARLFPPDEDARAGTLSEAAQMEQVAQRLRAQRHLLILDNAESITAAPASIPHALPAGEQDKLKTLLSRLRGGRTLVLLGSREPETWLTAGRAGPGAYPLPGLDPQAASVLVDRILARHGATRHLADPAGRDALQDLVTLLGGYPLPLTVVLPALDSSTPAEVLAELREGGSGADPDRLIQDAIEYSHGRLDQALQHSLLLLAPFTSVIPRGPILERYQQLLAEEPPVSAPGPVDLAAALDQAVSVGLAAAHPDLASHAQVQPVLPYFLRSRLRGRPELRDACDHAHYRLYTGLGQQLYGMLQPGEDPRQRAVGQAVVRAEYANLAAALHWALRTGRPITWLVAPLNEYLRQTEQHAASRKLLEEIIDGYPEPAGQMQQRELAHLHNLAGTAAVAEHRLEDAEAHYTQELALWQAGDARSMLGLTYQMLGVVAYQRHDYGAAEAHARRSLALWLEFGNERAAAQMYNNLGILAYEQRRFDEAEASYRTALDMQLTAGDRYAAAATQLSLGMLAHELGRYDDAETGYRQALEMQLEFGDRRSAASTYHRLGKLAYDRERFDEAGDCYRTALGICLDLSDRHKAAGMFNELGWLAHDQQRFEEAADNYRRALGIFEELGDRQFQARIHNNLGTLASAQGRFAEAEDHLRQAIEIFTELGDEHAAAENYYNLASVAQEQRRYADAERCYQRALDGLRDTDPQAAGKTATQLGILLARTGRHDDAVTTLLYAVVTFSLRTGDWVQQSRQGRLWIIRGLQWLHRERGAMPAGEFAALVAAGVPARYVAELTTGIDAAGDPGEE